MRWIGRNRIIDARLTSDHGGRSASQNSRWELFLDRSMNIARTSQIFAQTRILILCTPPSTSFSLPSPSHSLFLSRSRSLPFSLSKRLLLLGVCTRPAVCAAANGFPLGRFPRRFAFLSLSLSLPLFFSFFSSFCGICTPRPSVSRNANTMNLITVP